MNVIQRWLSRRRDRLEHPGETPAIRQSRRLAELTSGGLNVRSTVLPSTPATAPDPLGRMVGARIIDPPFTRFTAEIFDPATGETEVIAGRLDDDDGDPA